MTSLSAPRRATAQRVVRDSLIVGLGGQLERALGTLTALALRWGLGPAQLGVYSGLRLYLDQTNRSSLGIGLGAMQEVPILRAAGRHEEARLITNVAYTTNTITCSLYAIALLIAAWLHAPALAGKPLAAEWTWGLVVIAGLAILQRRMSFQVAVLRAHQEFALTTELAVVESIASAVLIGLGLALAGFWGLLMAVGGLIGFKILYLNARHPLRFQWCWDWPMAVRLMRVGLPIFANSAVFGAMLNLDRVLIFTLVPDGERAVGLYSIAIMGTSWGLDLAGRIVAVLYPHFQTTLGRTGDRATVAVAAVQATEAQVPILAAGSAVACVVGPPFLALLMPRYVDGLAALRPLAPGMLLLGLAWPARQMLIALGRPGRLLVATGLGLAITALVGTIGARSGGIVGVAWGMSLGFGCTSILTSATAFVPELGWRAWRRHSTRVLGIIGLFGLGTQATLALVAGPEHGLAAVLSRSLAVAVWLVPGMAWWAWGRHQAMKP